MTCAHIEVKGGVTRLNTQLRNFIEKLQDTQNEANRIKAIYDQVALGADYEALRDALGLEPDAGGTTDAETVYNLLGSVQTELNATFTTQLLGRLG